MSHVMTSSFIWFITLHSNYTFWSLGFQGLLSSKATHFWVTSSILFDKVFMDPTSYIWIIWYDSTYDNRPLFMTGIHGPIWSELVQDWSKIFKFFGPGPTFFAGPGAGTLKIFRSWTGTDRLVQDWPVLVLGSVKNGTKFRKLQSQRQNFSAGVSGTAFYSRPQLVELVWPVRRIHFEIKCT